jgi:hypothetical protein
MAHVFIVDENTFSTHLKYKFAGTGAKEYKCQYLENNSIEIKANVERLLSGMIADISRVKKGDSVIFYLQQTSKHEGMFFGSFTVEDEPFLCNDDFLKEKLEKNLTFRVKLLPDKVYKEGITERECLDSLEDIEHPSQMCWSLIYRKLKGNRGCTMITNYEYNQIMKKIELKNNSKYIETNNFDYDRENNQIVSSDREFEYKGKKETLNIKDRLIYKKKKGNAYETHLQAYILQNLYNIDCLKINKDKITWIGNEVSCGVGMQSIDICFIQENEKEANIVIGELKDEELYKNLNIKNQIEKYINWMRDYIVPTYEKKVILCPIIITSKIPEKAKNNRKIENNNLYKDLKQQFKKQNLNNVEIDEIRFIEFEIKDNEIKFERKYINE